MLDGRTWLVIGREVHERLRSRAFRSSTLIAVVAVVAIIVAPSVFADAVRRPSTVALLGAAPGFASQLDALGSILEGRFEIVDVTSRSEAEDGLRKGDLDVVIVNGTELLVHEAIQPGDPSDRARLVTALSLAPAITGQPLPISSLAPAAGSPGGRVAAFFATAILYGFLISYGNWIISGVTEEKTSHVAEVLLSTVQPIQLYVGKVVGIGVTAMLQGSLVGAGAVAARAVAGSAIPYISPGTALYWLGWLLIGYGVYAFLFGAAGALSTPGQSQQYTFPVMLPLIAGFIASSVATSGDDSRALAIMSYFPLTTPVTMPMRLAIGAAEPWQGLLAAGGCVIATLVLARLGAVVYARSILHTGRRLRLRDVAGSRR